MKTAWGIDIGDNSAKAVRLGITEGKASIVEEDHVEYPMCLSNPSAVPKELAFQALDMIRARNRFSKKEPVLFSLNGSDCLTREADFPPCNQSKIGEILRFEARQMIPFPIDEVCWNHFCIGGRIEDKYLMDGKFLIVAAKKDRVKEILDWFPDGFRPTGVQLSNLALYNCFAYNADQDETTGTIGIVSVGSQSTELVIVGVDDAPYSLPYTQTLTRTSFLWHRSIPLGGNHYTRQLAKDFKLTFKKAEHLKINYDYPQSFLDSLDKVTSDLVLEVERSVGFFKNIHHKPLTHLVFAGSGGQPIRLERFAHIAPPFAWESSPFYPGFIKSNQLAAFGLALQGLGVAQISTNLMPSRPKKLRNVFSGLKNLKRFIPRLVFDR